jgi:hypothetical protein
MVPSCSTSPLHEAQTTPSSTPQAGKGHSTLSVALVPLPPSLLLHSHLPHVCWPLQAFVLMVSLVFEEVSHRDEFLMLWQPLADHVRAEESGTLAFELLQLDTEPKELLVFERCGTACWGPGIRTESGCTHQQQPWRQLLLLPADTSIGSQLSQQVAAVAPGAVSFGGSKQLPTWRTQTKHSGSTAFATQLPLRVCAPLLCCAVL